MTDAIESRGPDDEGQWVEGPVALGSRRLSILDLSAEGRMPMTSADGRFVIAYNGEIYNFKELASKYLAGHPFRSRSDTEVLLELLRKKGVSILEELNGMFAFALWDRKLKELTLGRDRLGVKPLYYIEQSGSLYFASEEKAFAAAGLDLAWDESTLGELLVFRWVAGERTPFREVKRLLPGHYLVVNSKGMERRTWWSLSEKVKEVREKPSSYKEAQKEFEELFASSVRYRQISDVPVGVMLSGGLDSGAVAVALAETGASQVESFTVCFDNEDYNEEALARSTATKHGLSFNRIQLNQNDLIETLDQAQWASDEPMIHGNDPHLFLLSRIAKSRVSVLLSGEGADEVLGGYMRYLPLQVPYGIYPIAKALLPKEGAGRLAKLNRLLSEPGGATNLIRFNSANLYPFEILNVTKAFDEREKFMRQAAEAYPTDAFRQAMFYDHLTFLESVLHRNDRMTMGASIECRVPFLDFRLVEWAARQPKSHLVQMSRGKKILRDTFVKRLPSEVQRAKKWGFGVPWSRYLLEWPKLRERHEEFKQLPFARELNTSSPAANAYLQIQIFFLGLWLTQIFPKYRALQSTTRHLHHG